MLPAHGCERVLYFQAFVTDKSLLRAKAGGGTRSPAYVLHLDMAVGSSRRDASIKDASSGRSSRLSCEGIGHFFGKRSQPLLSVVTGTQESSVGIQANALHNYS